MEVAPENTSFQRVMMGEANKNFLINPSEQKPMTHTTDPTQLRTQPLLFRIMQRDNVKFYSLRAPVYSPSEKKMITIRSIANRPDFSPTNETLSFGLFEEQLAVNSDERKAEILVNQDKRVITAKNRGSLELRKEKVSIFTNNC
jgi:stress response protein YsnF